MTTFVDRPYGDGQNYRQSNDPITAVGPGTPIRLIGTDVVVQLDGPATAVTCTVQRSMKDPAGPTGASWAPVDTISGNPSTGIVPSIYSEPGCAWWRLNITALTGSLVNASVAGKGA